MAPDGEHSSLETAAVAALRAVALDEKIALTHRLSADWRRRRLSLHAGSRPRLPDRPGRPERPLLLAPRLVPKRGIGSPAGRVALAHAICHIELNAIDLALDIIARYARLVLPRSFFDDWVRVAAEEAKHFDLLRARLRALGSSYGDLPAHDGLWDAANATTGDLAARLALVPLVLEARGLDVTPGLIEALEKEGDHDTAAIFSVIYEDEKGHVAVGAKWFRFLCHREGLEPAARFQRLVREHFRGRLRAPFNDRARCASGITPTFYRALSPAGN